MEKVKVIHRQLSNCQKWQQMTFSNKRRFQLSLCWEDMDGGLFIYLIFKYH